MDRSARIALAFCWLLSGCFGDKVYSEGGGGAGAGAAGGSSNGGGGSGANGGNGGDGAGNGGDGGNGGNGGGGGPATRCTSADEGAPCDGGEVCGAFTCVDSECVFDQYLPASTSLGDNGLAGDCQGLFCSGTSFDSVQGPSDDPPTPQGECFAASCVNGTPNQAPVPPGSACSTGVCSGSDLGCSECISWANCASGKVCNTQTGACANCVTQADCVGNPGGLRCEQGSCVCDVTSDCQGNPAGPVCESNVTCGCATQDHCAGVAFGTFCFVAVEECGCLAASNCNASALGKACVMGRCGCTTNTDCAASNVCDVTANVCVPP